MFLKTNVTLFWRMFGVLLAVLVISFALWSQGLSIWQQYPRAYALAGQIHTAVNLTRNALIYTDNNRRDDLLNALNQDEGIGVSQREITDTTQPFEQSQFIVWMISMTQKQLGYDTEFAQTVNGEPGLWISFNLEQTAQGYNSYWIKLDIARLEAINNYATRWWIWMVFAILIALVGAIWMTRRLTSPLMAMAQRVRAIAIHDTYVPLPEKGVPEITWVNTGLNQLVKTIADQDKQRTFMLASLSHDLRTPLTRLRLEVELSHLSSDTKAAMASDIEQIDFQLKQLTDFANSNHPQCALVALDALIQTSLDKLKRANNVSVTAALKACSVYADPHLLQRAFDNIFENAKRYGRSADGVTYLDVVMRLENNRVYLTFKDQGEGTEQANLLELLEPFKRGDYARSGSQGNGLGLAIVKRVIQEHHGDISLQSAPKQGFCVQLYLPIATDQPKH